MCACRSAQFIQYLGWIWIALAHTSREYTAYTKYHVCVHGERTPSTHTQQNTRHQRRTPLAPNIHTHTHEAAHHTSRVVTLSVVGIHTRTHTNLTNRYTSRMAHITGIVYSSHTCSTTRTHDHDDNDDASPPPPPHTLLILIELDRRLFASNTRERAR